MTHRYTLLFDSKQLRIGFRYSAMVLVSLIGVVFLDGGAGCVGGECTLNSDCAGRLVCAYESCHIPCHEQSDCNVAEGEVCFDASGSDGATRPYCGLPVECETNADCGDGRVCNNKVCALGCNEDKDCHLEEVCSAGGCIIPVDTDAGQAGDLGWPCKINSDCVSRNCIGVCVGCMYNFDCGAGRTCDPSELGGKGMCSGDPGSEGGVYGFSPLNGLVNPQCVFAVCNADLSCCSSPDAWGPGCSDIAFQIYNGSDCTN